MKYPFGHGLSYTTFAYSALEVHPGYVSFRVRNAGSVAGAEIAQLYVHPKTGGMFRPEQELKGFAKVALAPGEEKEVSIALNDRSFAVWSVLENRWTIEGGSYELRIGASSRDIRLTAEVHKDGSVVNPYESFAALLGHAVPNAKWDRSAPIGFNDTISQGEYLDGGFGKAVYNLISFIRKVLMVTGKKEAANNMMFVMNLPWRGVSRMSGALTDEQVMAILDVINRKKGGFRTLLKLSFRK